MDLGNRSKHDGLAEWLAPVTLKADNQVLPIIRQERVVGLYFKLLDAGLDGQGYSPAWRGEPIKDVFVSYRRAGARAHTYRFVDELKRQIGSKRVFLDVKSIDPGVKYIDVINSARIVLVIIGPKWMELCDDEGKRKLEDPEDVLMAEIETALNSGNVVIPVLVDGATMPSSKHLPEEIRELSEWNAFALADSHWDYDVEKLISKIRESLGDSPADPVDKPGFSGKVVIGMILVVLVLIAYGTDEITDTDTALAGIVFLIVGSVLSLLALADIKAEKATGRVPAIVTAVFGIIICLALFGEWEDLHNEDLLPFYSAQDVLPYGDANPLPTNRMDVSGMWVSDDDYRFLIRQSGNYVTFQEWDAQTNTVTGIGTAIINGNNMELVDSVGRFTVSPDGMTIQGQYLDADSGEMETTLLKRQ